MLLNIRALVEASKRKQFGALWIKTMETLTLKILIEFLLIKIELTIGFREGLREKIESWKLKKSGNNRMKIWRSNGD